MSVVNSTAGAPTIDTHFHVFRADSEVAPGSRYQPGYEAGFAQWSALSSACGVEAGVLVQPSFLGHDNRQLLAVLDEAPHMRGVVQLAADTPPAVVRDLDARGVRGLRWNTVGRAADPVWRLPAWRALLSLACDLGWHLELHADAGAMPDVLALVPEVPVTLVLDHFGKPDPTLGAACATFVAAAERARRHTVYVKCSADYRLQGLHAGALLQQWRTELGGQALLWGSDWPFTNFESSADYAALHALPARWLGASGGPGLFDTNARRLFYARD